MKTISYLSNTQASIPKFLILILFLMLIGQTSYVQRQYASTNQTEFVPLWILTLGTDVSKSHTNCSISDKDDVLLNSKSFIFN